VTAILFLLALAAATPQTAEPSVQQKTQGACSPAVADVNGNVTITCTGMNAQAIRDLQKALALLQQLVAASDDNEPLTATFPVNFYLRTSDRLPLRIPGRPFPIEFLPYFDEVLKKNPETMQEDGESGQLYHEFLQKTLFEWIAVRYSGNWRVERLKFETGLEVFAPAPDAANQQSLVLTKAELEKMFGENRFAKFHTLGSSLALPLDSKLSVSIPKQRHDHGEIKITNRFCELVIDTSLLGGMRSLGPYGALLNVDPSGFWSQNFIVRVTATFTKASASASEMKNIKRWANDIVNGLQAAFDEQVIQRKTFEDYQRRAQMGQDWRNLVGGLGPIRFAPQTQPQNETTPLDK